MSFFRSLPTDASARHILALHPEAGRAVVAYRSAVLRQDSALTASLFNAMHRLLEGHGGEGSAVLQAERGKVLAHGGYEKLPAWLTSKGRASARPADRTCRPQRQSRGSGSDREGPRGPTRADAARRRSAYPRPARR